MPCQDVAAHVVALAMNDADLKPPVTSQLSAASFMRLVAASQVLRGRRLEEVDAVRWGELVSSMDPSNPMYQLRHYYLFGLGSGFHTAHEEDCKVYEQDAMDRILAYLQRRGLLPPIFHR